MSEAIFLVTRMITKIKMLLFKILFGKEENSMVAFYMYMFLHEQITVKDIPKKLRVKVRDKLIECGETDAAAEIDEYINNNP